MFKFINRIACIALGCLVLSDGTAMANDMINNVAEGSVGNWMHNDVYQDVSNGDNSKITLEVGSISSNFAESNTARGYIRSADQHAYGSDHETTLQVGSIKAKKGAFDNMAEGAIEGQVLQYSDHRGTESDLRVGSIDAGEGEAWGNTARGSVNGHVLQDNGFGQSDNAKLSARVGTMAPY